MARKSKNSKSTPPESRASGRTPPSQSPHHAPTRASPALQLAREAPSAASNTKVEPNSLFTASTNTFVLPSSDMHSVSLSKGSAEPPDAPQPEDGNRQKNPLPLISWSAIPPLLSYCVASILMNVVNKYALSGFPFRVVFIILFVQCIGCLIVMEFLRLFKFIQLVGRPAHVLKYWLPVALGMALMLYTGGRSLEYLPISVFTVFKNLNIIIVACFERALSGVKITMLMAFSFVLMIASSAVSAGTNFSFPAIGYFWTALNTGVSAFYVLIMRMTIKRLGLDSMTAVYYNNLLVSPMFLLLCLGFNEIEQIREKADVQTQRRFLLLVLASSVTAFHISYSTSWCMRVVHSTTYSMTGALNKLPVAMAGILFLGEPAPWTVILSISLAILAGVIYSISKVLRPTQ